MTLVCHTHATGQGEDHAGSRVIRMGFGHQTRFQASDEPGRPVGLCQTLRPITEGVVMPRTRVHNMNISLDGYAAGDRKSVV